MKFVFLAAFIAVVSSGPLSDQQSAQPDQSPDQWPWQQGKQYQYKVNSHTVAHFQEGASSGYAFKAKFVVRVKAPGQLQAKLENPQHGQFHQQLRHKMDIPADLSYKAVESLDKPFEISLNGGRFVAFEVPSTLSLAHENLLKGLLSALQVDLSTYHHVRRPQDSYDKNNRQGLFSKVETDVTGDCETLYSISPVSADWKRELPQLASHEEPVEITKSRNYGHCHHRVAYHFGVPKEAEWTGTAHRNTEKQFISHGAISRILVGKQGSIYKAETTSSVHVHPHIYGKQKAEVHSYVSLELQSLEENSGPEWEKPEGSRKIKSLLYSVSNKPVQDQDESSSSESYEVSSRAQFGPSPFDSAPQSYNEAKYSQTSSSSSSDSSMASVNDEPPKMDQPVYSALYFQAQPHGDSKQNPMNAQKLLLDISQQLQNPSNMPKAEFLTKFNILVRLISSMSTDQLTQTSRSIEVGKASDNTVKADMWMIFRDAVVQSGTPPAFKQIKSWIKNKKIQNEEAAEAISSLATTLRYPTKEIMKEFFDFALSSEVQEQSYLNTSALIAATKFIRMGHVDQETANSYYPIQMYGHFTPRNDRFVLEDILPRLSEKLKQAVANEQYSQAQVLIKAIGTLGHHENLHVFAPYLEGETKVPTYLRVQMIYELQPLADQNDRYARAVFFSILRNTAEPYEVRVAAILNIFRANPTTDMLHTMAEMTNYDPSIQVRAVLKHGIETAANLDDPRQSHLARSAQAVRHMVTSDNLGVYYSGSFFADIYNNNEEVTPWTALNFIGGDDSIIPKLYRLYWSNRFYGRGAENKLGFSVSSADQLYSYIKSLLFEPRQSNAEHKYSADKVSSLLNIKPKSQDPIQSSLTFEVFDQERYFAQDESSIKQLVREVADYLKEAENGKENHYTKVFYSKQVSVMFPIASGVPFIYKYKEPVVVHLQNKFKGKIAQKKFDSATTEHEIQFTFARNMDGSVGFVDTFTNQLASTGVNKKYQATVPIKVNIEAKSRDLKIKLQPLHADQDVTLAHFSVWPYSAIQKKDTLIPLSQDSTTKLIERPRKLVSVDTKYGQQIGAIFQMQGYSYSKSYSGVGHLSEDILNFAELMSPEDLAQTYYVLKYLGKQSQTKSVTLRAVYDEFQNQKQAGKFGKADNINDIAANSSSRRQEMVKRVSAGIKSATARVIDLGASFQGSAKQEYVFTAAYAESQVDTKLQAAAFLGSAQSPNEQINAVFKIKSPQISPLNYHDALKNDVKFTFEADVKYGQNSNINVKGHKERTKEYTEELKNTPKAKQCDQEMAKGNQYQPACRDMLIRAQAPDYMKATLTYKSMPSQQKALISEVFSAVQNQINGNVEYNYSDKAAEGQIELELKAHYSDETLNLNATTPYGQVQFENIPIPEYTPYLTSAYKPFGAMDEFDNFANYKTHNRHRPYCAVEHYVVKTFSDRFYKYKVSSAWHVVMHQMRFQEKGKWQELVLLAKRPEKNQLDLYFSLKTETGKHLELEIPASAAKDKNNMKVKTNAKQISEGELITYWDDNADAPLLHYSLHPTGVLVLNIDNNNLHILFNGEIVVISTTESRKETNGLCGKNTGDRRDDYLTPFGVVDEPQHFGASFAIDAETDTQTQQWKAQAKDKAYELTPKYTSILRSDQEWNKTIQQESREWGSQKVYRASSYQKQRGQCQIQNQVQYHENHGEICITTTPVPSCQSHCSVSNYQVQSVQSICKPKSDQQFKMYKNQIHQGQNPQVAGVPKVEQYRVPTTCTA